VLVDVPLDTLTLSYVRGAAREGAVIVEAMETQTSMSSDTHQAYFTYTAVDRSLQLDRFLVAKSSTATCCHCGGTLHQTARRRAHDSPYHESQEDVRAQPSYLQAQPPAVVVVHINVGLTESVRCSNQPETHSINKAT
jgi:hypothetical protein